MKREDVKVGVIRLMYSNEYWREPLLDMVDAEEQRLGFCTDIGSFDFYYEAVIANFRASCLDYLSDNDVDVRWEHQQTAGNGIIVQHGSQAARDHFLDAEEHALKECKELLVRCVKQAKAALEAQWQAYIDECWERWREVSDEALQD